MSTTACDLEIDVSERYRGFSHATPCESQPGRWRKAPNQAQRRRIVELEADSEAANTLRLGYQREC